VSPSKARATIDVLKTLLDLAVKSPTRATVGQPVTLAVEVREVGTSARHVLPDYVRAWTGVETIELRDTGIDGDPTRGDGIYSGRWRPDATGPYVIEYSAIGGSESAPVPADLQVMGWLTFGEASTIRFDDVEGGSETSSELDLSGTDFAGDFELEVSTDFRAEGTVLELERDGEWIPLNDRAVELDLASDGPRAWPLRLRASDCPERVQRDRSFQLTLTVPQGLEEPQVYHFPVSTSVLPDPWLHCWWRRIVAALAILMTAVIGYGYWSPCRFGRQMGVVLSPNEDLADGVFHAFRSTRGARVGFYRDARAFIHADYRVDGRRRGAVAVVKADQRGVRLTSMPGSRLSKRMADDEWEEISEVESRGRVATRYSIDPDGIFMEFRNR
jgi:hypothetical protein